MDIIPSDLNTYGGEANGFGRSAVTNERMFLVTALFLNTAKASRNWKMRSFRQPVSHRNIIVC